VKTRDIELSKLKPHPKNYSEHPEEQIKHIKASIEEHGFYRNVVAAKDMTLLAGHGVVEACRELGYEKIPVVVLDIEPDSTAALKVLTGDNYLSHFADDDDRLLTDILKLIHDDDTLVGTGFDEMMLANLAMVTRTEGELADENAAAEWVGMPEFERVQKTPSLVIAFEDEAQRAKVIADLGWKIVAKNRLTWSMNWGVTSLDDVASIRFDDDNAHEEEDEDEIL
jgi:hypothetical protein